MVSGTFYTEKWQMTAWITEREGKNTTYKMRSRQSDTLKEAQWDFPHVHWVLTINTVKFLVEFVLKSLISDSALAIYLFKPLREPQPRAASLRRRAACSCLQTALGYCSSGFPFCFLWRWTFPLFLENESSTWGIHLIFESIIMFLGRGKAESSQPPRVWVSTWVPWYNNIDNNNKLITCSSYLM